MPYIDQIRRGAWGATLDPLVQALLHTVGTPAAGELNYLVTKLAFAYIRRCGGGYAAMNAAIGALECAKLELYRRVAAPYESSKLEENGDVYL